MSSYGVCVGRMLSPIWRNAFFSCSRFNTKIDDLSKLTVTQMRRHYQSALNNELVNATSVTCLFMMEHIRLILILMRLTYVHQLHFSSVDKLHYVYTV